MAITPGADVDLVEDTSASSHTVSITLDDADDYVVFRAGLPPDEDIGSVTMDPTGVNTSFTKVMDPEIAGVGVLEMWVLWGSDVPGGGVSYDVEVSVPTVAGFRGNMIALRGAKEGVPERQGSKTQTFADVKTYNNECDVIAAGSWQLDAVWLPDIGVESGTFTALDGQAIDFQHSESARSFACGHVERASTGTDVECDYSWQNSIDEAIAGVVSISPSGAGGAGGTPVLAYATGVTRN